MLIPIYKSVRLIQLTSLFFDFLGIVKLITRLNECIICNGSESSNDYVGDSSIIDKKNMEDLVEKVTQLVAQNMKTDRQINYKQQNRSFNKIETPLSIEISMFIYHNTKVKS